MVAIAATTNATPSLQATLSKTRLEQARREADLAESNAQNLRAQADQAEAEAQKGQEKVRALTVNAQPDDATYSPLRNASTQVPAQTQDFLVRLYKATSQKFADSGNALKTDADAAPVINAQGQSTGRILNIKA
jgi:hypothetical protein